MVGNHDKIVMPSPSITLCAFNANKGLVIMETNPICIDCGVELTDENWYPSYRRRHRFVCKGCHSKENRQWRKTNPEKAKALWTRSDRKQGHRPMSENKECTAYLGVYVAEGALSQAFKNVVRMPNGNPGFDLICNRGKIDVKSACREKTRNRWKFDIGRNIITDYFLCLAFDSRKNLNPLHAWLIPGSALNHLITASISQRTIHKWDAYRLDTTKVAMCCNALKGVK